jgi:hypothetical protein
MKEDDMGGACGTQAEKINVCKVLVSKSDGKRSLGRSKRRWENNMIT